MKLILRKGLQASLVLAFGLLLLGCASRQRMPIGSNQGMTDIRRVAIIPFENISREPDAGKKVTNVFLARLYEMNLVEVVDLGEVDPVLMEERVRLTGQVDLATLRKIAAKLKVQGIILGHVEEYKQIRVENYQVPVVGVTVRMVDAGTGNIVWVSSVSRAGNDEETVFGRGRIISLTRLTQLVVDDMVVSLRRGFLSKHPRTRRETPRTPVEEVKKKEKVLTEEPIKILKVEGIPSRAREVEETPSKVEEETSREKTVEDLKEEARSAAKEEFEKIKKEKRNDE